MHLNGVNTAQILKVRAAFNRNAILHKYRIPARENAKYIIFTGTIGGYYKPEMILESICELNKKGFDINYILVGEGGKSKGGNQANG